MRPSEECLLSESFDSIPPKLGASGRGSNYFVIRKYIANLKLRERPLGLTKITDREERAGLEPHSTVLGRSPLNLAECFPRLAVIAVLHHAFKVPEFRL